MNPKVKSCASVLAAVVLFYVLFGVMILSPATLFPEVEKKAHAAEKQRFQRLLASKLNV